MMKQNFFHDKKKVAQRGFYLVVFLCVITVAVTGYIVTRDNMDLYTTQLNAYMDDPENVFETVPNQSLGEYGTVQDDEPSLLEEEDIPVSDIGQKPKEPTAPQPKPVSTAPQPAVVKTEPLYVWPVSGEITLPYSAQELVYSRTLDDWRAHMGMDIRAIVGAPVKAMADGEVADVYYDEMYGNVVVLSHSDSLKSLYCNLSPEIPVEKGQKVKAGDLIGGVGESALFEQAEVPHLHLEVLENGKQIDPQKYLKE
jgi:murein DD-endopeptidase MepM/ murein hydrolase activator NlpD